MMAALGEFERARSAEQPGRRTRGRVAVRVKRGRRCDEAYQTEIRAARSIIRGANLRPCHRREENPPALSR